MAKTIVVTNPPSSIVSIVLIDPACPETIPVGLNPYKNKLPSASFLLHNHTSTPITAVVTQWKITGSAGKVETQTLRCTGYMISPPRKVMVRPKDFTLITPRSCAKSELFSQLDCIAFNSPFQLSASGRLVDTPDDIERIEITVDSVIFEDGGIWGPDTQKYHKRISADYLAGQSVIR